MKKPEPIYLVKGRNITMELLYNEHGAPNLWLEDGYTEYGCVRSRDVKRLKSWCDKILKHNKKYKRIPKAKGK